MRDRAARIRRYARRTSPSSPSDAPAPGLPEDPLHQIVFVLIVAIERGPAHHRPRGQFADRERLEPPLLDQLNQRLPQQFPRAPHTQITLRWCHFALLVSAETGLPH